MNSCLIKIKSNPEVFSGFVSGVKQTSIDLKSLIEYTLGKIDSDLDGDVLDIENIQALLQYIASNDGDLSQEQVSNINYVQNNLWELMYSMKSKVILEPKASLNLDQTDQLIPTISQDLNAYTRQQWANTVFQFAYYSKQRGLQNPNNLHYNIMDFKNELFATLCEWLNVPEDNRWLYFGDTINPEYSKIMTEAWRRIAEELKYADDPYTASLNPTTLYKLNAIQAFYILNNFDDFLRKFSYGLIQIKETKFGTQEVSTDKYKLLAQLKENGSWEGNFSDQDSDRQFSKIFYNFWQTIDDGKYGKLTKYDFKKLANFVQLSLCELGTNSEWAFLDSDGMSLEELKDAACNALKNDFTLQQRLGPNGRQICLNIAEEFEAFYTNYNNAQNGAESIAVKRETEIKMNFLQQFCAEIQGHCTNSFVAIDDKENTQVKSATRITMSKEPIIYKLTQGLKNNLANHNFSLYSAEYVLNKNGDYLYSARFLNFLRDLTGLSFSVNTLDRFFNDEKSVQILFEFIDQFSYDILTELLPKVRNNKLENLETTISDFIKTLKLKPYYLDFSKIYIQDNRNDVLKILDQGGNPQPTFASPNTMRRLSKNIRDFKIKRPESKNIYFKYPQLIQRKEQTNRINNNGFVEPIVFLQDVAFSNGQVVKSSQLSPDELMYLAFNNLFLNSCIESGTFYNQTECYSDKVTIPLTALNMFAVNAEGKEFGQMAAEDWKNIYLEQHTDHYTAVGRQIKEDLKAVLANDNFQTETATLDQLIQYLESLTVAQFEEKVRSYNALNPNKQVSITKEIHYCEGPNKMCRFNNTLYFHLVNLGKGSSTLLAYAEDGLKELKRSLKFINIPTKFKELTYLETHWNSITKLFNIPSNITLANFRGRIISSSTWGQVANDDIISNLIEKYYYMQATSTEAMLFITSKDNSIHKPKGVTQLPISDWKNDREKFIQNVYLDQSERLKVGKKRNNALVASYLPMALNTKYGVSARSRIAVCQSNKAQLINYNGQTTSQDSNDGALWTLGIAMFWENASFPGKYVEGVKKVIGLIPTLTSFEQFKCADYPLDNILLQMCFQNPALIQGAQNFVNRARKMMRPCKLSTQFLDKLLSHEISAGIGVYKRFGGEVYGLSTIDKDATGNFVFTWTSTVDAANVKPEIHSALNTVEDLWDALGSYNTVEQRDGKWVPSNSSMEIISLWISEFDNSMKESIISKIVDVSSNKSGITNINALDKVDDDTSELNTHYIDNSRWGMQQDYTHEADESTIPSLTQVISAIAFNGKNTKLVGEMYEALAHITLFQAQKRGVQYNNMDFHRKLVKTLLHSFENTANSRSDALYKVRDIYQRMVEGDREARIAYSSPDIFYKLASDFITALNRQSIKQTYNGVAIVQNPSHNIIGIWEGNNGKTYTRVDLIRMATQALQSKTATPEIKERYKYASDNELVEFALTSPIFNDTPISKEPIDGVIPPESLEIEDTVQLTTQDGRTEIIHITNAVVLKSVVERLYSGETGTKIQKYQRNLKAPLLKFKLEGDTQYRNFWLTDAVQQRIAYEKATSGDDLVNKRQSYDFYRANLALLAQDQPYIYLTVEDFLNDGKQLDDGSIYNGKTKVIDVEFTPGEQILPKVNLTAQSLGQGTLRELEDDPEYFIGMATKKLKRINSLSLAEQGTHLITATKDDIEIVYTDIPLSNTQNPSSVVIGSQTYIMDAYNNPIIPITSSEAKIKIEYSGGKTIYYICDSTENIEQNINQTVKNIQDLNALYEDLKTAGSTYLLQNELRELNVIDVTTNKIDKQIAKYAEEIYKSFNLSNYTISARIPSQSFQSFMANKTVAFMTEGVNNGYVNIHEVWFTGSDYDIDKLYTMLYSLDKSGKVATISPLAILSTQKTMLESMRLPLPNKSKVISQNVGTNVENLINGILNKYINPVLTTNLPNLLNQRDIIRGFKESNPIGYLRMMSDILESLPDAPGVSKDSYIVRLLNRHNKYVVTTEGLKNKIVSTLYQCSTDINNLEASSQPMESTLINNLVDIIEEERDERKGQIGAKKLYNNINPYTKFSIQYENSVGKQNVGIAANGVKAAAALQQYYNEFFAQWDGVTSIPSYYTLSHKEGADSVTGLTLIFNEKDSRNIYKKTFVTLGDVVLDSDQKQALNKWIKLHEGISTDSLYTDSDIVALRRYLENGEVFPEDVEANGENLVYYRKDGQLRKQFSELEATWKYYKQVNQNGNLDSRNGILNFLFFKNKFNYNVADTISIMISLATDNAKELTLARINANPQLMSMPITMLTLGMDPKAVIDICVNLLDPIAKKMAGNRFQSQGNTNVRNLIQTEESYDEDTRASLLKVFDVAQELRTITSFFKVNQGVTAQYVELLAFYKRLASANVDMYERKGINEDVQPINLHSVFGLDVNPDIKKEETNKALMQFENGKTAINVMHVVMNNKNFFSMLQSLDDKMTTISGIAGAAKFIDVQLLTGIEDNDTGKFRKLINLYQDFIIGKTAEKMQDVIFTLQDLKVSLEEDGFNVSLGENVPFGLFTEPGIETFMQIMDNYVIPKLRTKYSTNYFFRSIEEKYDYRLVKNTWQLLFDVFNDEDITDHENILNATYAFSQIQHLPSGLVTIKNQSISIGEAMYLYNMLANKNRMSGLSMVVDSHVNTSAKRFDDLLNDTYKEYDKYASELTPQEFLSVVNIPAINQLAAMERSLDAIKDTEQISLVGKYLWSKAKPMKTTLLTDVIGKDYKIDGSTIFVNLKGVGILPITLAHPINGPVEDIRISAEDAEAISTKIETYTRGFSAAQSGSIYTIIQDKAKLFSEAIPTSTLKTFLLSKNIQSLLTNIVLKLETVTSNKVLNSRVGYVLKVQDMPVQIILDETKYSEEMIDAEDLLDLVLQSQLNEPTSVNKVRFLQTLLTDTDEKTAGSILRDYTDYLSNHYPEQEVVKNCVRMYKLGTTYLTKNSFPAYYQELSNTVATPNSLEVGDICSYSDSKTENDSYYMYTGFINNQYTFVNTVTGEPLVVTNLSDESLYKVYRLRVQIGEVIRRPLQGELDEWQSYSPAIVLNEGDKIKSQNSEYTIYTIVYDITNGDNYVPVFICSDKFGALFPIYEENIQEVQCQIDAETFNTNVSAIEIQNGFKNSARILASLHKNDIITLKSGEQVRFKRKLNSNTFVDTSEQQHSYMDIQKVNSNYDLNFDLQFKWDASPMTFAGSSEWDMNPLVRQRARINNYRPQVFKTMRGNYLQYTRGVSNYPVLRMSNYNLTKSSVINIGDIFIAYASNKVNVYKVTDIQNGVYEVAMQTSKLTKEINSEYWTQSVSFALSYKKADWFRDMEHWSQVYVPQSTNDSTTLDLTSIQKGAKVLEQIQSVLGAEIRTKELGKGIKAKFENGIIYVDKNINIEDIPGLAIHEFMHLALAGLRYQDPSAYVSLISRFVNSVIPAITDQTLLTELQQIDANSSYSTIMEKNDEKMIRYIDYKIQNVQLTEDDEALKAIVDKSFTYLLGLTGNINLIDGYSQSLEWLLSKYDKGFFTSVTKELDIRKIAAAQKLNEIIENIKEYCY